MSGLYVLVSTVHESVARFHRTSSCHRRDELMTGGSGVLVCTSFRTKEASWFR
jgi:hypothetical protein